MRFRTFAFVGITCIAVYSCKNDDFKKGSGGGMEYKFFKLGEGQEVQQGNWLKLQTIQKYNDSVLHDTHKERPQYLPFDSTILSKETYAIMSKVSVGDSLVFKVMADSAFKDKKPPFVRKKGGFLYTYIKVENIFRSEQEYKADMDPEGFRREQQQKEMEQRQNGFGQRQGFDQQQMQQQGFGQPEQGQQFGQPPTQETEEDQILQQNKQQEMKTDDRPVKDHH